jgi:sirohydrochlorin cobaltochelatase
MTSTNLQSGIILFAHGSRDALWRLPIEAVADRMRALSPNVLVDCAYLELTEPDLLETVKGMALKSIQHISIVPMFLGVGRHAREDLPVLVRNLQVLYPNIRFELRKAIGEEMAMTDAMAKVALAL